MKLTVAIACVPALGSGIAQAACDTPFPKDVKVEATAPSPDQAKFLGVWNGIWSSGICAVIAVKSIDKSGSVSLIYAHEKLSFGGSPSAGRPPTVVPAESSELTGHFENGDLKFSTVRGSPMSFKTAGEKLISVTTFQGADYTATWTK
jgi:hypothetical protein